MHGVVHGEQLIGAGVVETLGERRRAARRVDVVQQSRVVAGRPRRQVGGSCDHIRAQTMGRFERLRTEGFLNIDYNAAERVLEQVAIGRKN
ncbi:MAG: hypothetical protein JNK76_18240 [Planctomycetales bacterium]|nr:hypothetical protein [Planctomycetales bacterium]MBN8628238.1 hypothetical protein [Planctomycetota bacterium]